MPDGLSRGGCFAVLAAWASIAFSQSTELRVGNYTGSFTVPRDPAPFEVWMDLAITSIEQGTARGAAQLLTGKCAGSYAMEGRLADNKLTMKGSGGPCPFGFSATSEGDRLVGATGAGAPLHLSLESGPYARAHPLVGRYRGNMRVWEPLEVYAGLDLHITSVTEAGLVKGTATSYARRPCTGDFQMRGRYRGKELSVSAITGPCAIGFVLKDEGSRLVGSTGRGQPVELLKLK